MTDRDLKLNSLDKPASKLVLEAHSSCEVPAGCGGVILRWRRRSDLPFEMWIYSTPPVEVFLDGVPVRAGRPLIPPGDHVVAFRLGDGERPTRPVMLFAAFYDEKQFTHVRMTPTSDQSHRLVSAADGHWKYDTGKARDDNWMMPGFDDADWRPMIERRMPDEKKDTMGGYRLQRVVALGAKPIGPENGAGEIRIRRAFTIDASLSA
jgi:hypothetical protein